MLLPIMKSIGMNCKNIKSLMLMEMEKKKRKKKSI